MPQLDNVSFFSQLFWLMVVFFTLFIISVKYLLPRIFQILKVRKEKLELSDKEITSLKSEESEIANGYDSILTDSVSESKQSVSKTVQLSLGWLNTSIEELNQGQLLGANSQYVKTVGEISGKNYLIQSCIK